MLTHPLTRQANRLERVKAMEVFKRETSYHNGNIGLSISPDDGMAIIAKYSGDFPIATMTLTRKQAEELRDGLIEGLKQTRIHELSFHPAYTGMYCLEDGTLISGSNRMELYDNATGKWTAGRAAQPAPGSIVVFIANDAQQGEYTPLREGSKVRNVSKPWGDSTGDPWKPTGIDSSEKMFFSK